MLLSHQGSPTLQLNFKSSREVLNVGILVQADPWGFVTNCEFAFASSQDMFWKL